MDGRKKTSGGVHASSQVGDPRMRDREEKAHGENGSEGGVSDGRDEG